MLNNCCYIILVAATTYVAEGLECYSCTYPLITGCGYPFDENDILIVRGHCATDAVACVTKVNVDRKNKIVLKVERGCVHEKISNDTPFFKSYFCSADYCNEAGGVDKGTAVLFGPFVMLFSHF